MPLGSGEASLLRESRFWTAQLAGWVLILPLYFRDEFEWGIREGRVALTIALTATGWGMAIACSSALAAVYLKLPPRWLTGVRAVPIALGLSLLAAAPVATVLTTLETVATSTEWPRYAHEFFFHASVLMALWSVAFLWLMRSERALRTQAPVGAEAFALEATPSDRKRANPRPRQTRGTASSSASENAAVPWRLDRRVRLREGATVKFCRVREIAYIRAAGDYTEVHLSSGQVAIVTQRLRYWESQLPECFARIHRSTLINLELTEELVHAHGAWRVRLRGWPEALTVSRRYARSVKAKVNRQQDSSSI